MDDIKALAIEVLKVLDMQREYFRTRCNLGECKAAEARLRITCDELLGRHVVEKQPLFDI